MTFVIVLPIAKATEGSTSMFQFNNMSRTVEARTSTVSRLTSLVCKFYDTFTVAHLKECRNKILGEVYFQSV